MYSLIVLVVVLIFSIDEKNQHQENNNWENNPKTVMSYTLMQMGYWPVWIPILSAKIRKSLQGAQPSLENSNNNNF